MQVILTQSLKDRGKLGETISVKPGFARNYLFPRGIALLANDANAEQFAKIRAELEAKEIKATADVELILDKLEALESFTTTAAASEEGRLYGAITAKEIVKLIFSMLEITLNTSSVHLPQPRLRELGEYPVTFDLHGTRTVTKTLTVLPKLSS